jgi:hypothetical protein
MKKLILSLILGILPLALFGASGTAIPGGNQAAPFIINKPGAYYLAANRVMTTKGGSAIEITASDVTLDLNGYTLSYADTQGSGTGIIVNGSSAEIMNGSISTVPSNAVFVPVGVAGVRIIDLRIADTRGIKTSGDSTLIERCHIIDSRAAAADLGGWQNVLKDCYIEIVQPTALNAGGYGVYASSAARVIGNYIGRTHGGGIFCTGPHSVVKDNQLVETNQGKTSDAAGIRVGANYVQVSGNTIQRAFGAGIKISSGVGCIVERNVVFRTEIAGSAIGVGFDSQNGSTILRGNLGTGNAGGLTAGPFINGGDNLGN